MRCLQLFCCCSLFQTARDQVSVGRNAPACATPGRDDSTASKITERTQLDASWAAVGDARSVRRTGRETWLTVPRKSVVLRDFSLNGTAPAGCPSSART